MILSMNLTDLEHVLYNGVHDGIISKTTYRQSLILVEKKYGKMLKKCRDTQHRNKYPTII